ncbi:hypothetical protein [Dongia rigui]|uniref:Uncharacterized protein n=1 Tax=Dongia rigui TaxID=940149 RepID=A0ABU5E3R5_9PROT|nr:hypothetical protein [Dongia rigui]MDY0874211.1 hypothetical protein [Dongia rigui]
MARAVPTFVSSRRFLALVFVALASGMLVLENWPADAHVSRTGDDVAVVDADLPDLPVMYE